MLIETFLRTKEVVMIMREIFAEDRKEDHKVWKLTYPLAITIILSMVNPLTEALETQQEWLFMTSHYLLAISGFLLTYKLIKGKELLIIPAAAIAIVWHLPYFYAMAGSMILFRIMCDVSMVAAGMLIGISTSSMSTLKWLVLFVLWMIVDTIFSIFLLLQFPAYSNSVYSFSPFNLNQEVSTAVAMWIVMSVIIAFVLGNFLRKLLF
jgi:lysylphosphatidylglycerol synthetase-like protein (DUF2156 family)